MDDDGTVSNEGSIALAQESLAAHSEAALVDNSSVVETSTEGSAATIGASSHSVEGGDHSEVPVNPEATHGTARKDFTTPRQRLEAAGVVFDDSASDTSKSMKETCTYYVVTLTWEAH